VTANDAGKRSHPPPDQRYRLYLDESGDHVYRHLAEERHRYLCLLGCWFRADAYQEFHARLEALKQKHVPHSPDEPVILHREDIINCRGPFWRLREEQARQAFDDDLVGLIEQARFTVVAVVVDKATLQSKYPTPAHPYHLAMGFMLQRYCGYLNHVNRRGDVMAEARGGREDRKLKESYSSLLERGAWCSKPRFFQQALTSRELKVRPKSANIAGLQLADLLAHPVRYGVLWRGKLVADDPRPFAGRLLVAVEQKYNRHLYDGRVDGYGIVLFPK
jgi:hypothetical protein